MAPRPVPDPHLRVHVLHRRQHRRQRRPQGHAFQWVIQRKSVGAVDWFNNNGGSESSFAMASPMQTRLVVIRRFVVSMFKTSPSISFRALASASSIFLKSSSVNPESNRLSKQEFRRCRSFAGSLRALGRRRWWYFVTSAV